MGTLRLWLLLGTALVAAGAYLVVVGGNLTLARGLLLAGLLYMMVYVWAERRKRP